jgi:hypothetical protein
MANFARLHLSETEFKWTTWDKLAGLCVPRQRKSKATGTKDEAILGKLAHLKHKKYPNLDIRAKCHKCLSLLKDVL